MSPVSETKGGGPKVELFLLLQYGANNFSIKLTHFSIQKDIKLLQFRGRSHYCEKPISGSGRLVYQ